MGKKVFLKTIPRETATKISDYRNESGERVAKLNKTKMGRCKTKLDCPYSSKTRRNITGLDIPYDIDGVKNPYKNKTNLPQEFVYLKDKEQISLQEYMEVKHGVRKDYYTSRAAKGRDNFNTKGADRPFFWDFTYAMNDGTTMLDMDDRNEELAYYMFKSPEYKKVANSEQEWRQHKYPYAQFYISYENEGEELKFESKKRLNRAVAILEGEQLQDVETMKKFVKILKLAKDISTVTQGYNLIDTLIKTDKSTGAVSGLNRFLELAKLLDTAEGRERLTAKAELADYINHWIITEKAGTYTWVSKAQVIANREEEAIDFLVNPGKDIERSELELSLKSKRGY